MNRMFRLTLTLFLTFAALALPTAAHATQIGAGYSASDLTWQRGGQAEPYSCYSWSGGSDGEGNSYLACDQYIYKVSPTGVYLGAIPLEDTYRARRDVAVSQDGSRIYYVVGPPPPRGIGQEQFDPNDPELPNVGKVVQLVRQADGSYRRNAGFNVGPFYLIAGDNPWAPRNIDVDQAGRVYVTVNAYVKVFSPTGSLIATFGNVVGGLEIPQGLSVAADGNSLLVVEQQNDVVQRWRKDLDGSWHRDTSFQIGQYGQQVDGNGSCDATFDYLASPYDVDTDGAGNIYVLDTSCHRMLKYSSTGSYLKTIWYTFPNDQADELYHGFAVNWKGDVIIAEQGRRYTRTAQATALDIRCAPDYDAPRISNLSVPSTVYARSVTISLSASDHCSQIAGIRILGADVTTTHGWRSFHRTVAAGLSAGAGTKRFTLSVRDSYGHVSSVDLHTRYDNTPPRPRRHINIRGASRYCQAHPLSQLGQSGWLLADACATFNARVVAISQSGGSRFVQVEVGARTARKMFSHAHGPMQIWVVGRTNTPMPRRLRVGSYAQFTAALVVDSSGRSLSAAPAWRWSRI